MSETSFKVHWLNNPFDYSDKDVYPVESNTTIQQCVDSNGGVERLNYFPTVCVYQGRELLRSEYDQVIEGNVCFVVMPQGGDQGSDPVRLALQAALLYYTFGAFGATAAGTWEWSQAAVSVAQGALLAAGGAAINLVRPLPGQPSSSTPSTGSPTYAVGAQGNQARLSQPIPVNYGKMRIYPDFAARPYTEYESNEQYLYQLFCIGQGLNEFGNLRLDNTPLNNFEDATVEVIKPHEKVTLLLKANPVHFFLLVLRLN